MKKELKQGDLVRLKKNLKVGRRYGEYNYPLLSKMVFDGFRKIEYVTEVGSLLIGDFYYRKEMLTK